MIRQTCELVCADSVIHLVYSTICQLLASCNACHVVCVCHAVSVCVCVCARATRVRWCVCVVVDRCGFSRGESWVKSPKLQPVSI